MWKWSLGVKDEWFLFYCVAKGPEFHIIIKRLIILRTLPLQLTVDAPCTNQTQPALIFLSILQSGYKTYTTPPPSPPPHAHTPFTISAQTTYLSKANCLLSKWARRAAPTATQRECQSHDRQFQVLCFRRMDANRGCSSAAAPPGRGNANNSEELVLCLYSADASVLYC